ncbi:putative cytochrome P450 E-class, group IV [Podospora australis]|uniref:Cytochrome P450 E-class, group IV n=1 Tax=Podospora australis TaxID=1536484 RepID=A0AAN7AH79_9PEZI|nr:putative cytochrome P450 E-class, group IV [Podospora australis]
MSLLNGETFRSSLVLLLYLFSALVVYNIVYRVHRWNKLRHIPGPLLAGWTSLWLTNRYVKWKIFEDMKALSDKYGPIVRIAPDKVIISDVETIYRITSARSNYKKSDWYVVGRVMPGADNLLSMRDPELRKKRLKHVLPAYQGRGLEDFESGIDKALQNFLHLIDTKYLSTKEEFKAMNLAQKAHFYTLDSFGEIAYSQSFGSLDQDKDVWGIVRAGDNTFPMLSAVNNHHELFQVLSKWPFYYLMPREGDKVGLGAMLGHATHLVNQRLSKLSGKEVDDVPSRDMLQSFIDHGLAGEELKSEVAMSLKQMLTTRNSFVGSDTVASAIRITMLLLMTHPNAYRRLQDEIDAAAEAGRISRPVLSSEANAHLPFLQAVIRESLRLFPPSSVMPFPKEVPMGGDTVCGKFLPAGTLVCTGSVMWSVNHDETFWGRDADLFRPERWLEADAEKVVAMNKCVDLIFGSGKFVCVGRQIGFMQMNKVLPELLRRYNWSLPDPCKLPRIDNPTVWDVHDLSVKVEKRR